MSNHQHLHTSGGRWGSLAFPLVAAAALCATLAGCSSDSAADGGGFSTSSGGGGFFGEGSQLPPGEGGSSGVVVPGAADFALFRKILRDGGVPAPDTLDDLGFFAEHKLDFKAPTCGEKLCMDARVGIRPNMINGSTCTIVQVGLNSPVKPEDLVRPPLHLIVLVQHSSSMSGGGMAMAKEGLARLIQTTTDELPSDKVSLLSYGETITEHFVALGAEDATTMEQQALGLAAKGAGSNLYAGLKAAYALAAAQAKEGWAARVLLIGDGTANRGIVEPAKVSALVAEHAAEDRPLTIVAVGKVQNHDDLIRYAEAGAGNLYVAESGKAVQDIFVEEQRTAFFAIARDVDIRFKAADGWAIRGVYGVRDASIHQGEMSVRVPALYLAKRQKAADPIEGGRRGGGGVLQVELIPLGSFDDPKLAQVGTVGLDWNDPVTGKHHGDAATMIIDGLSAAKAFAGAFSDFTSEKGFVMLNIYVGLKMAAGLVSDGDTGAARSVLGALLDATSSWLAGQSAPDPDIEDDLKWIKLFRDVIATLPAHLQTPLTPTPNPWPSD
jgi:Ca-activated chloride channel family protein